MIPTSTVETSAIWLHCQWVDHRCQQLDLTVGVLTSWGVDSYATWLFAVLWADLSATWHVGDLTCCPYSDGTGIVLHYFKLMFTKSLESKSPSVHPTAFQWRLQLAVVGADILGAVGATAPIETGWVGVAHPKNWSGSNFHILRVVLFNSGK